MPGQKKEANISTESPKIIMVFILLELLLLTDFVGLLLAPKSSSDSVPFSNCAGGGVFFLCSSADISVSVVYGHLRCWDTVENGW